MAELFWLSDRQWTAIEPLLPNLGGKPRVDDRRVISGIDAVKAIWLRTQDNDALMRKTIATQLEATTWPSFASVSPL